MWLLIQKSSPIVYFDATGNVCKKIENQKIPLFYTLSMYDSNAKSIVSIADFITTCHTTSNICLFLFQIKFILSKYFALSSKACKPIFEFPTIFVMDQSDVLLNSILCVFDNLTIVEYLIIAFNCVIKKDFSEFHKILSMPYNDSIHLMKNFIQKSKKIKHFDMKFEIVARKFSVFCFCLLQCSTTIEDFEYLYENIYNVFMQPNKNEKFIDSIVAIEYCISNRNIYPNIQLDGSSKDKKHFDIIKEIENSEKGDQNKLFTKKQLKSVKKNSPFRKYFDKFKKYRCKRVDIDSKLEKNIFFNPGLFNLIDFYTPIIPLWTGVFVNFLERRNFEFKKIFRLNSNPAEKNFDILKHKLILKSGAMPSEIASIQYERLNFKFNRDYSKRICEISNNLTKEEDHSGSNDFSREIFPDFYSNEKMETWKKGKRKKNTLSFYYNNNSNISYLDLASGGNVYSNLDFSKIFSGKVLKLT